MLMVSLKLSSTINYRAVCFQSHVVRARETPTDILLDLPVFFNFAHEFYSSFEGFLVFGILYKFSADFLGLSADRIFPILR